MKVALTGRPLLVVAAIQLLNKFPDVMLLSGHILSSCGGEMVLRPLGERGPVASLRTSLASPRGDLSVGREEGLPEVMLWTCGGLDHVEVPAIVGCGVTDRR